MNSIDTDDIGATEKLTPTNLRQCALCERMFLWKMSGVEVERSYKDMARMILGQIGHDVLLKIEQSSQIVEFLIDNDLDAEKYLGEITENIFESKFNLHEKELKELEISSEGEIKTDEVKSILWNSIYDYSRYKIENIPKSKEDIIPAYTIQRIEPMEAIIKSDHGNYMLRGIPDLLHVHLNRVTVEEIKFKLDPSKIPDDAYGSDIVQLGGEVLIARYLKNLNYLKHIIGSGVYFNDKNPHRLNYNGRIRYVDIDYAIDKALSTAERCRRIKHKDREIRSIGRAGKHLCEKCDYRDIEIEGVPCRDYI